MRDEVRLGERAAAQLPHRRRQPPHRSRDGRAHPLRPCEAASGPSCEEFHLADPKGGRPPEHGGEFLFGDPATWGIEQAVSVTSTGSMGRRPRRHATGCTRG